MQEIKILSKEVEDAVKWKFQESFVLEKLYSVYSSKALRLDRVTSAGNKS